jgi:broad specificity phosphatase PhoE
MTRFILIRHGQTEWNRVERFRGRADVPLNPTGLSEALATGVRVAAAWKPCAVYSSPLSRSVRTAEAVARHFDLPVRIHPGLADIDYGRWQGRTPDEARQDWPEEVRAWYETPEKARIPGGETLAELQTRAMAAVAEISTRHPEETVVLVGHTVVNRIILLAVLGLGNERFWHLRQEPCAINEFEHDGRDFTLVSMNDTCHLAGVS